jgi:hypothetical protein
VRHSAGRQAPLARADEAIFPKCHDKLFCSRECQLKDWPSHKTTCRQTPSNITRSKSIQSNQTQNHQWPITPMSLQHPLPGRVSLEPSQPPTTSVTPQLPGEGLIGPLDSHTRCALLVSLMLVRTDRHQAAAPVSRQKPRRPVMLKPARAQEGSRSINPSQRQLLRQALL